MDLTVFCCVVRNGSFSRAATELGYSAAYISKRISDLELKLSTRLFNRTTRTIQITREGSVAHSWAEKILESADALEKEVTSSQELPTGSLRIATSLRLGREHVAPILSELVREYPSLDVWLELVDHRVDLLEEGIDIDIRNGTVGEPHVVSQLVQESSRVLVAAPEYLQRRGEPKSIWELTQHDCLLYKHGDIGHGSWRLQGPNGTETVRVDSRSTRSHHSDIVKNWAVAGHGIILLAEWDVVELIRQGKMVRVLPEYRQQADIWAVTPMRSSNSVRMKTCVDYLIRNLQQGPYAVERLDQ
ncbi:LysR substrate-binding domain-containing protein [Oceanobacter mangrovi]|uniref:LysR substrate-binding domain-containing protein n=1 Tax=Oceanobacter mangrovi TaxID=2862510 RepID=UPI001C8EC7DC|nr:LysR substrate-binding domain-containing protein [Oceanobacter mangrovi]